MQIKLTTNPKLAQAGSVLLARKHYATADKLNAALTKLFEKQPVLKNFRHVQVEVDGRFTALFLHASDQPILAPIHAGFCIV